MGDALKSDIITDLPRLRSGMGVDLAAGHVSIVRAQATRRGLHYETLLETGTADAIELRDALRELQPDLTLGRILLSASLPVSSSSTRWLTAPYPSIAKAKRVFPALLDIELPLPLESCEYGFIDTSLDQNQVRTLAFAAPHATINKRLDELRANQLDPHVLDHEGLALWQHHCRQARPSTGLQFIVYLGENRTVWVAGEGNQFLGAQSTQSSYQAATQSASSRDASVTESVRSWQDRSSRFLRTWMKQAKNQRPRMYWVGPGAAHADALSNLQTALADINAEHHEHANPRSFLAAALAANLVDSETTPLNFRTGTNLHPLLRALYQRSLYKIAAAMGAAAILLVLLNTGTSLILQQRMKQADAHIMERAREITGMARLPRRQELTLSRRTMTEAEQSVRPLAAFFEQPLADELQRILSLAEEHQWTLDSITLDEQSLRLRGTVPSRAASESVAIPLEQEGWSLSRQLQTGLDADRLDILLIGERSP